MFSSLQTAASGSTQRARVTRRCVVGMTLGLCLGVSAAGFAAQPPTDTDQSLEKEAVEVVARTILEMRERPPIYVVEQCDEDTVGQRIAYRVREGVRESAGMQLADNYSGAVLTVSVVCLKPDRVNAGISSTFAYAISAHSYDCKPGGRSLLTHGVQVCGADRVAHCAEDLVAVLDSQLIEWRRWAWK